MAFIVHMYRNRGNDFYSFHEGHWNSFYTLGIAHGWVPRGTTPTPDLPGVPSSGSIREWAAFGKFTGDYQPEDIAYDKLVTAEDAQAWANALTRVLDEDFPTPVHPEVTRKFIEFLRGGAFGFAWDD